VTAAPASAAVLPDVFVTSVTNPPDSARAAIVFDFSGSVARRGSPAVR